jgi:hypothetical protein
VLLPAAVRARADVGADELAALRRDVARRAQRVEHDSHTSASGDLYLHRISFPPPGPPFPFPLPVEPNPAEGIPVFTRANYVRVTQILEGKAPSKNFTYGCRSTAAGPHLGGGL